MGTEERVGAPIELHAIGDYWHADRDERTELGRLMHHAKDLRQPAAIDELTIRLTTFIKTFEPAVGAKVVPVPPSPDRPNPLLAALTDGLRAAGVAVAAEAIVRRAATVPLRGVPEGERERIVVAGGYEVCSVLPGPRVVLLDDVMLTGTTIRHVGALLLGAGAERVVGLAVARTRRPL